MCGNLSTQKCTVVKRKIKKGLTVEGNDSGKNMGCPIERRFVQFNAPILEIMSRHDGETHEDHADKAGEVDCRKDDGDRDRKRAVAVHAHLKPLAERAGANENHQPHWIEGWILGQSQQGGKDSAQNNRTDIWGVLHT